MQLTELLDLSEASSVAGEGIPCRENDAELWFADTPEGVEFAKALCGTCPARTECLSGALQRREPWGVWGGELFVQGVVVARKRPRGRPRKAECRLRRRPTRSRPTCQEKDMYHRRMQQIRRDSTSDASTRRDACSASRRTASGCGPSSTRPSAEDGPDGPHRTGAPGPRHRAGAGPSCARPAAA